MAAAASINVNYPNLATENESEYRSQSREGLQLKPSYRLKHYEERYSGNASMGPSRRDSLHGEKTDIETKRSHLDMNSELQDMVCISLIYLIIIAHLSVVK